MNKPLRVITNSSPPVKKKTLLLPIIGVIVSLSMLYWTAQHLTAGCELNEVTVVCSPQ